MGSEVEGAWTAETRERELSGERGEGRGKRGERRVEYVVYGIALRQQGGGRREWEMDAGKGSKV